MSTRCWLKIMYSRSRQISLASGQFFSEQINGGPNIASIGFFPSYLLVAIISCMYEQQM